MSITSYMSTDYKQSSTPVVSGKHILRPRVLTKEENMPQECHSGDWSEWRDIEKPKWDNIESPQFIDFFNIPDARDSFFDQTIIASTPKPNNLQAESFNETQDETLVNSLDNISISTIISKDAVAPYDVGTNNKENKEPHVNVQNINHKTGIPVKRDNRQTARAVTKPFTVECREKQKLAVKEETKWKPFKANPVPKFVKERLPFTVKKIKEQNAHTLEKDINANEEEKKKPNIFNAFLVPKVPKAQLPSTSNKLSEERKQSDSEKHPKKIIEIWKRKPFIPQPAQRSASKYRTPRLSTAARAVERKRYDESLKEKEKEEERRKEMEELARRKKEEEQIAELRKMTVHKAQPIRKYKSGLPQVQKRPLTDPITPRLLKRQRYT